MRACSFSSRLSEATAHVTGMAIALSYRAILFYARPATLILKYAACIVLGKGVPSSSESIQ
jgi:hypothetical protein